MADSPLDKLEFLLSAIATIFHSVSVYRLRYNNLVELMIRSMMETAYT